MGDLINKTLPAGVRATCRSPSYGPHKGRGFSSALSANNFQYFKKTTKCAVLKPLPLWEGLGRDLLEFFQKLQKLFKNPALSPQEATSLPQGERTVGYADTFAALSKARYFQNLAPISPLAGEMSLQATERGFFLFKVTPTLYPSPQGGGGHQHCALFFTPKIKQKNQKKRFDVSISLPLVGRDTGWGYSSCAVHHA